MARGSPINASVLVDRKIHGLIDVGMSNRRLGAGNADRTRQDDDARWGRLRLVDRCPDRIGKCRRVPFGNVT
jgi:hypothetical protein